MDDSYFSMTYLHGTSRQNVNSPHLNCVISHIVVHEFFGRLVVRSFGSA